MLCPNCSNDNRAGARFCDACGTPLPTIDEMASKAAEDSDACGTPLPTIDKPEAKDADISDACNDPEFDEPAVSIVGSKDAFCEREPDKTLLTVDESSNDFDNPELDELTPYEDTASGNDSDGEDAVMSVDPNRTDDIKSLDPEDGIVPDDTYQTADSDILNDVDATDRPVREDVILPDNMYQAEATDNLEDDGAGASDIFDRFNADWLDQEVVEDIDASDAQSEAPDHPDIPSSVPTEAKNSADAPAPNYRDIPSSDPTESIGVNLAGFDHPSEEFKERLAFSDYSSVLPSYRDGNTLQMPRVEEEQALERTEYRAPKPPADPKRAKTAAIVAGVFAALCCIVAFATYEMQMWGGKIVPDVTGMTEADARSMLYEAGFSVRTLEIKSDDTEGLVVLSDPTPGMRQEEDSEVVIHIATSREIPDVIGLGKKKAKSALAAEGYDKVKFTKEKSDNEKGTVISTDPKAGSAVKSTSKVVVTLATPYVVPDVAGMDLDSAIAAIQDEGLAYDTVQIEVNEGYEDGELMGTEPAAGTEVKSNEVVTIQIALVRGPMLESLAFDYLEPGSEVTIGGYNYIVDTLETVTYVGNDTVEFTITGRPFTELLGQTLTGSKRTVNGSILFSPNNKIIEVS